MSSPLMSSSSHTLSEDGRRSPASSVSYSERDALHGGDPPTIQQRLAEARAHAAHQEEIIAQLELEKVQLQISTREAVINRLTLEVQSVAAPPTSVNMNQTPARPPLVRRRLIQSSSSRRGPSTQALAHQAGIAELPDATSAASVVPLLPAVAWPQAAAPRSSPHVKLTPPKKFSGSDEKQNLDVENWIQELEHHLKMSGVPTDEYLEWCLSFLCGPAITWHRQKAMEVAEAGKLMTWSWLQQQLIKDYGLANGAVAMKAEWEALRMGAHGDKATRTVAQYTNLFNTLMMALTDHTHLTRDLLVIDRYVRGIKDGYPALHAAMLGKDKILNYDTLSEAVEGAQLAEAELAISKTSRSVYSSQSSRLPQRAAAVEVSNLFGELEDETATSDPGGEGQPNQSVNVVTVTARPSSDGRHKLTAAEKQMLYEGKRCYRCYAVHPFGAGKPKCNKPVQKVAPAPLN
jgi:hypothetical protein